MEKKPDATDKLIAELLAGKSPEEILGADGLVKPLTKRLVARALDSELTTHLGYEKHAVEGHHSGNSRNGTSSKKVKSEGLGRCSQSLDCRL